MLNSVLISAPFGNYPRLLRFDGVTYTLGTFTAQRRSWLDKPYGSKWFRVFLTVRPNPFKRSWRNKLGLKNPGIDWLVKQCQDGRLDVSERVVSVFGFNPDEWLHLLSGINKIEPLGIELNASCPNVDKPPFDERTFAAAANCSCQHKIVKIPPVKYEPIVQMAYANGIRSFHACNTLPSPKGGISGKPLVPAVSNVIPALLDKYPDIEIIAGGGVTTIGDASHYLRLGATRVALGSMLFNPFNHRNVGEIVAGVARIKDFLAIS